MVRSVRPLAIFWPRISHRSIAFCRRLELSFSYNLNHLKFPFVCWWTKSTVPILKCEECLDKRGKGREYKGKYANRKGAEQRVSLRCKDTYVAYS